MRKRLVALLVVLAALLPSAPAHAFVVPVLTINGRGWGHGVGLSQAGAHWMSEEGATTEQILGHFYPGTTVGTASGQVRVVVHAVPEATVLQFPGGGEVRSPLLGNQPPRFPIRLGPGGMVRVRRGPGGYHVETLGVVTAQQIPTIPTSTTTTTRRQPTSTILPPPPSSTTTTTSPPSSSTTSSTSPPPPPPPGSTTTRRPGGNDDGGNGSTGGNNKGGKGSSTTTSTTKLPPVVNESVSPEPVWAVPAAGSTVAVPDRGRRYRGLVKAIADTTTLRLVNQIDVEDYLRGMGEVRDPSWPLPSLQSQAIIARTYALRAMQFGEICDYDLCQVYLGQQAEYPAMDWAIATSRGRVLQFGGALASAVYSANAGGISATTREGFGPLAGKYPYLRSVRYKTRDPFPWTEQVALADLAGRFGYQGTVTDVRVAKKGPSGRAIDVELRGDAGSLIVPGLTFASKLGLRSTLFRLRVGEADKAPPPPKAADLIQALPDDRLAIRRASRDTQDSLLATQLRLEQEEAEEEAAALAASADDDDVSDALAALAVLAVGVVTAAGMAGRGLQAVGAASWPGELARPALRLPVLAVRPRRRRREIRPGT